MWFSKLAATSSLAATSFHIKNVRQFSVIEKCVSQKCGHVSNWLDKLLKKKISYILLPKLKCGHAQNDWTNSIHSSSNYHLLLQMKMNARKEHISYILPLPGEKKEQSTHGAYIKKTFHELWKVLLKKCLSTNSKL